MADDALSLWIKRRHGEREEDEVKELIKKKKSSDEKLARMGK